MIAIMLHVIINRIINKEGVMSNTMYYVIYPCFSANSRALCSLTTRLSSRSDLFPQRIMSGSSQYA